MRIVDRRNPVPQQPPSRWYGVYPARVTSVNDPDHQARVEVELGFGPVVDGQRYRVWARLATFMGGPKRGSFFVPDPEDEVLVAFYAGDPSHPYVVGALWNGKDEPPASMDGAGRNNVRVLKTRSGHKLEFDDTDGMSKITLITPRGCSLVLDDTAGGKITIQHPAGSSIEFDSAGGVKITAPLKLTIEAPLVDVNASMSSFNGCTQHQTMISQAVVGATYTPGAGNIW